MYPEQGETIVCEYCKNQTEAKEDMPYWLCVSDVKAEEESNPFYFCNWKCLKAYAGESERLFLERMKQEEEDRRWKEEEEKKE